MPTVRELTARVLEVGRGAGLDAVGVAPATPFTRAREALEQRKREGLHGGMAFTYKNPARSTDPEAALEGARAIVVGARSYRVAATSPLPGRPTGVVARYAQRDHYKLLGDGLRAVAAELKAAGWKARVVVDDNALVDREAAYRAGLGWFGKSANILLPGHGQLVRARLGGHRRAAATDRARRSTTAAASCRRCLDGVPDRCDRRPGRRRCPAVPGLARCRRRARSRASTASPLGDRIYGCDECQEVCPPNRRADRRDRRRRRRPRRPWVDVLDIARRVRRRRCSPPRPLVHPRARAVRYLRRNALVVLGNIGDGRDPERRGGRCAAYLEPIDDDLLRAAARRVGRATALGRARSARARSRRLTPSPLVLAEL